jgi:heavy metal translocating P-type ATPase
MDLLASIALVFSLLSGEWVSAIFIELMLAAARILEDVTKDRTERSIRGLLKLRPELAQVEQGGTLVKTKLKDIRVGDIVVVSLGERIPVDGVVLSGEGSVNESTLTGESLPIDKKEGSRVMSSTLVESGSLRVRTTHTGKDTTLERVIRLVESAREEKPSAQTLGEKFGKIYLISIFIGAACIYFFTQNLSLLLAVVLVVCADDVAVAIPIAYLRAIRTSAAHGVIVKGGKHLELLGQIKTIVFDKTGTLTTGKLVISSVATIEGESEKEVVEAGLVAACRSSHPFSKALQQYAKQKGLEPSLPDSVEEKGGMGIIATKGDTKIVTGRKIFLEEMNIQIPETLFTLSEKDAEQGKSISYIAKDSKCIGFFSASDTPKPDAKTTLAHLRTLGVKKFVMLSGDNARTAESIAREIGIDEWHAELKPEDKVEAIRRLQSKEHVAMVGDGVNDAAALSIASVGIAMGGLGSEGTIESAQIVLMRDDLKALPMAIQIAHSARRVSKQDFYIWGSTNLLGLILVFGGVIGPAGAAAYNFLSDFLPLANSLRVGSKK